MTTPVMNPMAVADVCDCISLAIHCAETVRAGAGPERAAKAGEALRHASVAAMGAFPDGSPEADALNVLLSAASAGLSEVTA
jgi:hypothetical protein